jgi:hypothetical protein
MDAAGEGALVQGGEFRKQGDSDFGTHHLAKRLEAGGSE